MLDKVGLAEKIDADPLTLSGGQQQRVAIAGFHGHESRCLTLRRGHLCPRSGPHPRGLPVIKDLIKEGMTMILVTHDMDFARDISDRVIFMNQGRIDAQGPPAYIFDERPTPALRAFLQPE